MNSEKYVCPDCGKVISRSMKRRHKNRCWPKGPVLASSGKGSPRALGRSPYPYNRLRKKSKYD